jgi:hypothetical protein
MTMTLNVTRPFIRHAVAALGAGIALGLCALPSFAQGLQPLDDAALSTVQGRDGLSFDLSNFSMSGDARITYYAPAPSNASAWVGNMYATRSDNPDAFSDPYRLDVVKSDTGLADIVTLAFPTNAAGGQRWQYVYDWGVSADGADREGGSVMFKDAVFYGGGVQWSTPRDSEGIAFGLALRFDIANLLLRPRGRGDITQVDSAAEQMNISGIRVGAVDSSGNFTNTPWRIADVTSQPGVINAVTDANGQSRLHVGIDWPDANGAPLGGLEIGNITFKSNVTGNLDLGSSRIGSIQIQYLDVKFRN